MAPPQPVSPEMPTSTLREMIRDASILVMPGVYDGYSGLLVERAGFQTAFITGAGIAESHGVPDIGLIGLPEALSVAQMLASRTRLLLIADADTGYGNALNVYETVRAFERAGVAGVMIEDQVWPKRCGHMAGKSVIPADEMVAKVKAAVAARANPDFVIKARTDAAAPLGLDEAVRRANLYAEAGADLVFADALTSLDDIKTFVSGVDAPVAVNMGFGIRRRTTTPLISAIELEKMGVAVVEYPRLLTAAAVQGMSAALAAFADGLTREQQPEKPELLVDFETLNDLVGLGKLRELEAQFAETK
jgi:2-methylisocitrate lyase-like PEP mutase family enzyme